MIKEKILDATYYYNKLPIYLQQSEGFFTHFEYWIELLNGIYEQGQNLSSMLNVFDEDYLTNNPNCSNFLDKLGLLYGVSRRMLGEPLNNKMMLLLIKCQIVKNFFNGSAEQIIEYYQSAKLPIGYITTDVATCTIYLITDYFRELNYSDDEIQQIESLFQMGFLTIQSLGIEYVYQIVNLEDVGFWEYTSSGEDYGCVWAEDEYFENETATWGI